MAMLGIVKKHCQRKAANFGGRKPGAGRAEASDLIATLELPH
jgi:hypothetical protein